MTLADLHNGECGFVKSIQSSMALRTHLEEMGFVEGQRVFRTYASPTGSPVVYAVMGSRIALREEEARCIEISECALPCPDPKSRHEDAAERPQAMTAENCHDAAEARESGDTACPDCGSSMSCPNCAPKREFTPKKEGDIVMALVGNPNCGKTAFFNAACGGHERTGNYAGVTVTSVKGDTDFEGEHIHIIDLPGTYSLRAFSPDEGYVAHELERGEIDVIINVLDTNNLERNLLLTLQLQETGIPVIGALNMFDEFRQSGSHIDIPQLKGRLGMELFPTVAYRGTGIKEVLRAAVEAAKKPRMEAQPVQTPASQETTAQLNANIRALLHGVYGLEEGRLAKSVGRWDRWLLSRPVAYAFFFLIMWLIFQATFTLGQYPMDWIDAGVAWLQEVCDRTLAPGWLHDLLVQGVLGGVGSVIVFLPNILILYFLISLLEDSGYLARAATLADPLLKKAGLHGKSFIPMLMGFGCNVPAVMATRTIESRKSRLVTMLVIPFMSCSARIPIYLIFAGAFFPDHAGTVMFLLYAGGIVVAFLSAIAISKMLSKQGDSHFVMEIPPYRWPMLKSVVSHTWERGREYLRKMSHVILIASVVIWVLQYFPRTNNMPDGIEAAEPTTVQSQQENSYLAQIGKAITPVFEPLGYNWQMTTGILTGVSAKELMVSTLGVLYSLPTEEADEAANVSSADEAKGSRLAELIRAEGTTSAAALSFLVFALLYIPCIATVAALKNESGHWRYALFGSFYTFAVAYALAFAAYRIALMC